MRGYVPWMAEFYGGLGYRQPSCAEFIAPTDLSSFSEETELRAWAREDMRVSVSMEMPTESNIGCPGKAVGVYSARGSNRDYLQRLEDKIDLSGSVEALCDVLKVRSTVRYG